MPGVEGQLRLQFEPLRWGEVRSVHIRIDYPTLVKQTLEERQALRCWQGASAYPLTLRGGKNRFLND